MSMRSSLWLRASLLIGVAAFAAPAPAADNPAVARARAAMESGSVDANRDLAPLVAALRSTRDVDEQRDLIEAISDLGSATGSSPLSARAYLLESSTPVLLEIARTGSTPFVKGDALLALRDMGASRAVLEKAAAIAEADANDYVRSRGEILRGFIAKMPAQGAPAARQTDPEREKAGIASLRQRGLGVSADQLARSAQEGDVAAVKALLDAGVDPNAGPFDALPLYRATFSGCGAHGGETDALVETVTALLEGGAGVTARGDNGATVLFAAAQMCGPRTVGALVDAGAELDARSTTGLSALGIALLMQKIESAEVLVARGARLTPQEAEMVSGSAGDPRAQAVIRKASRG